MVIKMEENMLYIGHRLLVNLNSKSREIKIFMDKSTLGFGRKTETPMVIILINMDAVHITSSVGASPSSSCFPAFFVQILPCSLIPTLRPLCSSNTI